MKIGILIDELIPGGFQKVAIMEAKYFKKLGHEASLVVLHRIKNEGYEDLIKENNIRVIRLSDRLPFLLKINFKFPFFAFFSFFHIFYPTFIWRYIERDEFDFFITHGTYTTFSSIAIKKKLKIPFISFIHDSVTYILENKYRNKFPNGVFVALLFVAKRLDCKIINNSDAVIAFPDMIKEMKNICPAYQNYHEIFNGCEAIKETEINFNKSNFAIAATKWDQGKNFGFLLDIWNSSNIKIPLKVIGSFHPATLKDEMEQLVNKKGLNGIVEIVGQVTEEELSKYYRNAKFLVHPCREAFGMTILEASANGCPAIFTNNSGVAVLYPSAVRDRLPVENDLKGYSKEIACWTELGEDDYCNLVKDYYAVAVRSSWVSHSEQIIGYMNNLK